MNDEMSREKWLEMQARNKALDDLANKKNKLSGQYCLGPGLMGPTAQVPTLQDPYLDMSLEAHKKLIIARGFIGMIETVMSGTINMSYMPGVNEFEWCKARAKELRVKMDRALLLLEEVDKL